VGKTRGCRYTAINPKDARITSKMAGLASDAGMLKMTLYRKQLCPLSGWALKLHSER
jgi:hypothetical protein